MMPDDFYAALCNALDIAPTPWRRAFLDEWARWEGTGAKFNPLATTQPGGEDEADPYWNTFGDHGQYHVRNYATLDRGAAATAETLRNGYYPAVLASIADQQIYPGASDQVRTWGTTGFAGVIDGGWQPAGTDLPGEAPPGEEEGSPSAPPPPPLEARVAALEQYTDRINYGALRRFRAVEAAFDHLIEGMTLALAEVTKYADDAADPDNIP